MQQRRNASPDTETVDLKIDKQTHTDAREHNTLRLIMSNDDYDK